MRKAFGEEPTTRLAGVFRRPLSSALFTGGRIPRDTDLRSDNRLSVACRVDLDWEDGREQHRASGRCLDISTRGAKISVSGMVPVSSSVHLHFVEDLNFEAYGVVRYASQQGFIGVEFSRLIWCGPPVRRRSIPLFASIATPLTIIAVIVLLLILFPSLIPDWRPFSSKGGAPPAPTTPGAFTLGSTKAEVRQAQGPPAKMTGPVWYYESSRVYFESGRVAGWSQSSDRALNVEGSSDKPGTPKREHFAVGATPADVMAVEGAPTELTANVWRYGKSEVYFRDGRVVGWKVSPTRPLRAVDRQR